MTDTRKTPSVAAGDRYWVVGDLYTFHVTGTESEGAYAAIDIPVAPGHGTPPHTHTREHEAFHILEGEVEFHTRGEVRVAGAGDIVHAPKGITHHYRNARDKPARMTVWLIPAGLEGFFAEIGQAPRAPGEPAPVQDYDKLMRLAPEYGLVIEAPTPS